MREQRKKSKSADSFIRFTLLFNQNIGHLATFGLLYRDYRRKCLLYMKNRNIGQSGGPELLSLHCKKK